jgi:hypothetical protein
MAVHRDNDGSPNGLLVSVDFYWGYEDSEQGAMENRRE